MDGWSRAPMRRLRLRPRALYKFLHLCLLCSPVHHISFTAQRHAATRRGAVPAGFPRRDGFRVQVDGGGGDPGAGRRRRGHGRHHGRHVGDRGGDGAGAGHARRARRDPGPERQGRRGHARAHPPRVPRRRRPRAAARPQLPRLRPRLRRQIPRAPPAAQPPHKQCRQVLARPARALGGRRRDDIRHQLSWALPADEAAAGAYGGDGGGDGRAGPHRQRVLQRPRMVHRRLGRLPPPRHKPKDTLRRDAGVRGVQARQRAAHPRARRAPPGSGRQRDGQLRPPGHRQDPPQPRPRRSPHRSGVLAAVQAAENDPSGCGDHVLRGGPPEGGRRVRPLLRRLQRGAAVAGGHQPPRGRAPLANLRGHDRRPAASPRPATISAGADSWRSNLTACQLLCTILIHILVALYIIYIQLVAYSNYTVIGKLAIVYVAEESQLITCRTM